MSQPRALSGPFLLFVFILSAQIDSPLTSGRHGVQLVASQLASGPELRPNSQVPTPIPSASYISLDGLSLVIVFSQPVNLSAAIESVEQRLAAAANEGEAESPAAGESMPSSAYSLSRANSSQLLARELHQRAADANATTQEIAAKGRRRFEKAKIKLDNDARRAARERANQLSANEEIPRGNSADSQLRSGGATVPARLRKRSAQWPPVCRAGATNEDGEGEYPGQQTAHVVGGVQICAQLLTRKTLFLLHEHRLRNCLWATQLQFLIQLGRPMASGVKIAFRRGALSAQASGDQVGRAARNERELAVELNKLPLEGLGVPLAPRIALTGPNQVASCGQFSLTAHLSSPYGTQAGESVRLQWSVERIGLMAAAARAGANSSNLPAAQQQQQSSSAPELVEAQWQALKQLVSSQRANSLVLDAQLLQFAPQLYEFRLSVTFTTSLTSFTLNASHQVSRLDFDAPIGTIYGSHLLALEPQLNTNTELALLADVQVPECAHNIKQVGLYWQVSDPRVRFEQTYAPLYLAKSNSLPEQALIEFRLNLFYGIRVKKFASASTFVSTGDSVLEAQISDGLLVASLGQPQVGDHSTASAGESGGEQVELSAVGRQELREADKYTYQWSCFDGKTAQPCQKSLKVQASSRGTRYDLGAPASAGEGAHHNLLAQLQAQNQAVGAGSLRTGPQVSSGANLLLVDKSRQRQPVLRLPLGWFEANAQLWFGLQRFDRHNPSQHSKTEYALVSVYPLEARERASTIAIGPVLVGRARQRATIRNPLTGAIVLLANTPAIIVGRLSAGQRNSFAWRIPNYPHPLYWTSKNVTNPLNNREELLTELHLNPDTLLAHAHYQVQLVVCGGPQASASLALDVVQGVSQCRVEVMSRPPVAVPTGAMATSQPGNLPLVVAVNYCNIPLGLSPVTYQLYIVDTSASDGFIESHRPASAANKSTPSGDHDDYTNEADELFYEIQAQPLTVSQLSPVFALSGLSASAMMALVQSQEAAGSAGAPASVRVRFAARVCNRLQSCAMFYSNSIDPTRLMAGSDLLPVNAKLQANNQSSTDLGLVGGSAQPTGSSQLDQPARSKRQAIESLRDMLEIARRANTAGNSIAAISVLNAVMTLGQRLMQRPMTGGQRLARTKTYSMRTTGGGGYDDDDTKREAEQQNGSAAVEAAESGGSGHASQEAGANGRNQDDEQLERVLRVATRDALQYGAQSIQRPFHYTDSGQTNVVLLAMSRILTLQPNEQQLESKQRALRLINLLVRKSSELAADSRLGSGASLPDFKTIQVAYESVFGAVGQHSVDSLISAAPSAPGGGGADKHQQKRHNAGNVDNSNSSPNSNANNSNSNQIARSDVDLDKSILKEDNNAGDVNVAAANNAPRYSQSDARSHLLMAPSGQPIAPLLYNGATRSGGARNSRAAAPLTSASTTTTTTSGLATSESAAAGVGDASSQKANRRAGEEAILAYLRAARAAHRSLLQAAAIQLPLGAVQQFEFHSAGSERGDAKPAANIVSSLTHQTRLPSDTIDVELHEFGSAAVSFSGGRSFADKLARELANSHLRCRNDTQTKCASFVLALSLFAGKAPFRSLDVATATAARARTSGHGQRHKSRQRLQAPLGAADHMGSLRVPVLQIDWLSPIDGSSLIDLLRADRESGAVDGERLMPNDFKASVTFTVPGKRAAPVIGTDGEEQASAAQAIASKAADRYKCFQFAEGANEWVEVGSSEVEETNGAESAGEQRIRCTFAGFGVLGAFQGRPPAVETSTELSIAIGVGCILAIVTIFSLLGCVASKSKAERAQQREQHPRQRPDFDSSSSSLSQGSSSYVEGDNFGTGTKRSSK